MNRKFIINNFNHLVNYQYSFEKMCGICAIINVDFFIDLFDDFKNIIDINNLEDYVIRDTRYKNWIKEKNFKESVKFYSRHLESTEITTLEIKNCFYDYNNVYVLDGTQNYDRIRHQINKGTVVGLIIPYNTDFINHCYSLVIFKNFDKVVINLFDAADIVQFEDKLVCDILRYLGFYLEPSINFRYYKRLGLKIIEYGVVCYLLFISLSFAEILYKNLINYN